MAVVDGQSGALKNGQGFRRRAGAPGLEGKKVSPRRSDWDAMVEVARTGRELMLDHPSHERRQGSNNRRGTRSLQTNGGDRRGGGSCRRGGGDRRQRGSQAFFPIRTPQSVMAVVAVDADEQWQPTRQKLVETMLEQTGLALKLARLNSQGDELRARVIQNEKMASLGQLIAGIAHEINNPVSFVSNNFETLPEYVGLLRRLLGHYDELYRASAEGDGEAMQEARARVDDLSRREDIGFVLGDIDDLVRDSTEGFRRITEVVGDLKRFARKDDDRLKEADINDALCETLRIVNSGLKSRIRVNLDLGDLPQIQCRPSRLKQVFMNLLVNAAQAIQERGQLDIATSQDVGEVVVSITDTGEGIPVHVLPRIFEPFFTTKAAGTGLGLSICKDILTDDGGSIEVESETGKGTQFTIRLPMTQADADETSPREHSTSHRSPSSPIASN